MTRLHRYSCWLLAGMLWLSQAVRAEAGGFPDRGLNLTGWWHASADDGTSWKVMFRPNGRFVIYNSQGVVAADGTFIYEPHRSTLIQYRSNSTTYVYSVRPINPTRFLTILPSHGDQRVVYSFIGPLDQGGDDRFRAGGRSDTYERWRGDYSFYPRTGGLPPPRPGAPHDHDHDHIYGRQPRFEPPPYQDQGSLRPRYDFPR